MKLQAEVNNVAEKIAPHSIVIRQYTEKLKTAGGCKDFETRIAWDVLNAFLGTAWICDLYQRYNCNDTHITMLGIKALKNMGIL